MRYAELRISVSWKAYVYRDAEQLERHTAGADPLCLDDVLARFARDLSRRGVRLDPPDDPLHEEGFVELLSRSYVTTPSVFDT